MNSPEDQEVVIWNPSEAKPRIEIFQFNPSLYRAVTVNYPNCCYFAEDGASKDEALDNLEESMLSGYRELGKLVSPILERREKKRKEAGRLHPNYGDLHTREEWGNSKPDGSYYLADETHYYPELSWFERTDKHTHVLYFPK